MAFLSESGPSVLPLRVTFRASACSRHRTRPRHRALRPRNGAAQTRGAPLARPAVQGWWRLLFAQQGGDVGASTGLICWPFPSRGQTVAAFPAASPHRSGIKGRTRRIGKATTSPGHRPHRAVSSAALPRALPLEPGFRGRGLERGCSRSSPERAPGPLPVSTSQSSPRPSSVRGPRGSPLTQTVGKYTGPF